ncbi:hypothetical protein [Kineococcus rhizosphaerae]|uniref:Uncharacterized protein n=1 Tax=Kineococcus rhizosphaerae TaxID=559628 RepID=A0A2T0R5B1_9ACTN|nr:hypothetical protein [Kineococcus rhizosphaerae]PRY15962.1 hypothetical protein CLV37_104175 [Kineococcus rhizosphaerae]
MTPDTLPTRPARPRETLEQVWRRLQDEGSGWTHDLLEVVEPYVLDRPAHPGDIARFRDLPWTAAARLLQLLPRERLADKQNGAPSLGSVLVASVGHPREVEVHGYLVPPSRSDERITAEGIVVYDHPELEEFRIVDSEEPCEVTGCEHVAFWSSVQASFGLADADHAPQLIVPRQCRRTGRAGWYLWWD